MSKFCAKSHSEVLVARLDKEISIRWILQDPKTGVIYMGDQTVQRILSVIEGKIQRVIEIDDIPICAHLTETKLCVGVGNTLHQYDIRQDPLLIEVKTTITSYLEDISAICSLHNSEDGGLLIGHSWGYMDVYPRVAEDHQLFNISIMIPGVNHVLSICWSGIRFEYVIGTESSCLVVYAGG